MDEENDRSVSWKEVQDALNNMNTGKTSGLDRCHVECTMKGGRGIVEWLVRLFSVYFKEGAVPLDWKNVCVVALYKGKEDKYECSSFKGISL